MMGGSLTNGSESIREAQKHAVPTDPQHYMKDFFQTKLDRADGGEKKTNLVGPNKIVKLH
jgi:hypothetical protein